MRQQHANKNLTWNKSSQNCGELMQKGSCFTRRPYYSVCADVVVMNKNRITPHRHTIPAPSRSESPYSSDAADLGAPLTTPPGSSYPVRRQSSSYLLRHGFTTLNKRSARGFASSAEVVATTAIDDGGDCTR